MKCCIEFDTSDQASYIPQVESILHGMGIETQRVNAADIMHGALIGSDMVTFPGGLGAAEGLRQYGDNFAKAMQFFVASGCSYLGICGGCYSSGVGVPGILGLLSKQTLRLIDIDAENPPLIKFLSDYVNMQKLGQRLLCSCDITDIPSPITDGHEGERVQLVYSGGPIIMSPGSSVTPLAYYYNDTLADVRGQVAVAFSQFGKGRVVVSGPHPEAPLDLNTAVGEPCARWLYEAMVQYCLAPAAEVYFPVEVQPWQVVKPLFSPAVPLAALGAFMFGVIVAPGKKCRV
jgi:glutamine amidotransferase-like uncharacterized protein